MVGFLCMLKALLGFRGPGDRAPTARETKRMVAAREDERNRLYYDLHDGLGPGLATIRLRLDTIAGEVGHKPKLRQLVVDTIGETVRIVEEVQRLIDDLRPLELEMIGLPGALRMLAKRMDSRLPGRCANRPEVRVDAPEELDLDPGHPAAVAAYRIVAEALNNALRHASANEVVVRLRSVGDSLCLEITDDGVGIASGATPGVGLLSMGKRAAEAGGSCEVLARPNPHAGTVVRAVLPCPPVGVNS